MMAWTVRYGKPFPLHRRLFDRLLGGPSLFSLELLKLSVMCTAPVTLVMAHKILQKIK